MDNTSIQLVNLLLPIAVSEITKLVQFLMSLGKQGQVTAAQIVAAVEHMEEVDAVVKDRARKALAEAGVPDPSSPTAPLI